MNRISKSATLIIASIASASAESVARNGNSIVRCTSAGVTTTSNYELMLLKRNNRVKVATNFHVFPGGKLEERVDESPRWQANRTPTDIGWRMCAIRETFEETGLLLARPRSSESQSSGMESDWLLAGTNPRLAEWLERVRREPGAFVDMFEALRLVPCVHALQPWSRWITPTHESRRFDTMFYLCLVRDLAASQTLTSVDTNEIAQLQVRLCACNFLCDVFFVERERFKMLECLLFKFVSGEKALELYATNRIGLMPPTLYELLRLSRIVDHVSLVKLCESNAEKDPTTPIFRPKYTKDRRVFLLPGNLKYDTRFYDVLLL